MKIKIINIAPYFSKTKRSARTRLLYTLLSCNVLLNTSGTVERDLYKLVLILRFDHKIRGLTGNLFGIEKYSTKSINREFSYLKSSYLKKIVGNGMNEAFRQSHMTSH